MPKGMYGRIASRSGLSVKRGIEVGAGVIDSDYTGEIMVLIYNFGTDDFVITIGDRIAQLIFEYYASPSFISINKLPQTSRNAMRFGSTG